MCATALSHRGVVSFPSLSARPHLAAIRRAVLDAARRGVREAAVALPIGADDVDAVRQALVAEGFHLTAVAGEDGPYAVVHW